MMRAQRALLGSLIAVGAVLLLPGEAAGGQGPCGRGGGRFCETVAQTGLPLTFVCQGVWVGSLPAEPGDQLCILDAGQGFLPVGSDSITGAYPLPLTAWQGDPDHSLPGASCGNPIAFQLLHLDSGVVLEPDSIRYTLGDRFFCGENYTVFEAWFPGPPAVCCVDGNCLLVSEGVCEDLGGAWHPEWDSCDPDPCPSEPSELDQGVFIAHHVPEAQPSGYLCQEYYSQYAITSCEEQLNRIDGSYMMVWYVLSAWSEEKEWCGVAFGLGDYDPDAFYMLGWGPCCPGEVMELSTPGWPGPNEGTAIVALDMPWEGNYVPVYYFVGIVSDETVIPLDTDPQSGLAGWTDCELFEHSEATCLGSMGVLTDGSYCCPSMHVCCVDGDCLLLFEDQCAALGGEWHPELDTCDPDPCYQQQDWANHDVGNCVLTVTDQGILGFMDGTQLEGSGFVYPTSGSNSLYIGSLWAGESETYIANRDFDADPEREWMVSIYPDGHVWIDQPGYSEQDIHASYTDGAAAEPRGLYVDQESWAFSNNEVMDDFVILRYTIENQGVAPLADLYVGVFLDFDIDTPTDDVGSTDIDRNLVHMTDAAGLHVGLQLLEDHYGDPQVANVTLIHNPTYVWPSTYVLDVDKYGFLSAGPGYSVPDAPDPDDYSVLASAGPFSLPPAQQQLVAFAIVGGEDLQALLQNADVAQLTYEKGKQDAPWSPDGSLPVTRLLPCVPNPFGNETRVRFELRQPSELDLGIYDLTGRCLRTLATGRHEPNRYSLTWNSRDAHGRLVPGGVYFLKLSVGKRQESRRVVFLR